jgi:hypothetical protein
MHLNSYLVLLPRQNYNLGRLSRNLQTSILSRSDHNPNPSKIRHFADQKSLPMILFNQDPINLLLYFLRLHHFLKLLAPDNNHYN